MKILMGSLLLAGCANSEVVLDSWVVNLGAIDQVSVVRYGTRYSAKLTLSNSEIETQDLGEIAKGWSPFLGKCHLDGVVGPYFAVLKRDPDREFFVEIERAWEVVGTRPFLREVVEDRLACENESYGE